MSDLGSLWGLATIVGPILLGIALVYASVIFRRRRRASKSGTDEATRNLYRQGAKSEQRESSL